MIDAARGERLWDEAHKLLASRLTMDAAIYHGLAVRKANEIRDWMEATGEEVLFGERPDIGTQLGKAYDELAKGASDTVGSIMPSPLWRGVKDFAEGVATQKPTMDAIREVGDAAGDAAKNAFKGARGFVYGGIAILGLGIVAIAAWKWRS